VAVEPELPVDTYGDNKRNLTWARGYIKRLLDNAKVVRLLNGNHPDIVAEFEKIGAPVL